jgi:hypothetical protein
MKIQKWRMRFCKMPTLEFIGEDQFDWCCSYVWASESRKDIRTVWQSVIGSGTKRESPNSFKINESRANFDDGPCCCSSGIKFLCLSSLAEDRELRRHPSLDDEPVIDHDGDPDETLGWKCGVKWGITVGFELWAEVDERWKVFNEVIQRAELSDLLVARSVNLLVFETFPCLRERESKYESWRTSNLMCLSTWWELINHRSWYQANIALLSDS